MSSFNSVLFISILFHSCSLHSCFFFNFVLFIHFLLCFSFIFFLFTVSFLCSFNDQGLLPLCRFYSFLSFILKFAFFYVLFHSSLLTCISPFHCCILIHVLFHSSLLTCMSLFHCCILIFVLFQVMPFTFTPSFINILLNWFFLMFMKILLFSFIYVHIISNIITFFLLKSIYIQVFFTFLVFLNLCLHTFKQRR